MRREQVDLGPATMIAYGHYGRPVLVFASEQGRAWDFENNGMVGAVADLVDAGRVKLYCVDSADGHSWSNRTEPIEERARRHDDFERWILERSSPGSRATAAARARSSRSARAWGPTTRQTSSCARRCLPVALCLSGNYDPRPGTPGEIRATPRTSTTRWPMSRTWTGATSTGCAAGSACCWSWARARGRSIRPAPCPAPGRSTDGSPQGDPPRTGRLGLRRPARLAVLADPAPPPPSAILLRDSRVRNTT